MISSVLLGVLVNLCVYKISSTYENAASGFEGSEQLIATVEENYQGWKPIARAYSEQVHDEYRVNHSAPIPVKNIEKNNPKKPISSNEALGYSYYRQGFRDMHEVRKSKRERKNNFPVKVTSNDSNASINSNAEINQLSEKSKEAQNKNKMKKEKVPTDSYYRQGDLKKHNFKWTTRYHKPENTFKNYQTYPITDTYLNNYAHGQKELYQNQYEGNNEDEQKHEENIDDSYFPPDYSKWEENEHAIREDFYRWSPNVNQHHYKVPSSIYHENNLRNGLSKGQNHYRTQGDGQELKNDKGYTNKNAGKQITKPFYFRNIYYRDNYGHLNGQVPSSIENENNFNVNHKIRDQKNDNKRESSQDKKHHKQNLNEYRNQGTGKVANLNQQYLREVRHYDQDKLRNNINHWTTKSNCPCHGEHDVDLDSNSSENYKNEVDDDDKTPEETNKNKGDEEDETFEEEETIDGKEKPEYQGPPIMFIEKPYPVKIEKRVPVRIEVPVEKPFPVYKEVKVPVRVRYERLVPYYVPKPMPVIVTREIPVPVEKKVSVPVKQVVDAQALHPLPYLAEKEKKGTKSYVEENDRRSPKVYPGSVEKRSPKAYLGGSLEKSRPEPGGREVSRDLP